ncbi:MAG TPA: acetate/propionate family kinase [Azospirillaceae bacterium]|nr:acetate/propionate family kinase [Azospirillaceae bacterium]
MSANDNAIVVINAGSSSLKFSVFVEEKASGNLNVFCNGQISGIGTEPRFDAKNADRKVIADRSWPAGENPDRQRLLSFLIGWIEGHLGGARLVGAGHRVVHGGRRFHDPVMIDDEVMTELERLIPLAPLHQPHNLAAIKALAGAHAELPQVACFDTAFHFYKPEVAARFALPRALTEEGVRRYGFHGLSYEYIARTMPTLEPALADGRIVVCHLGSGASMCGIHAGKSMDSSMGFTAVDGLPMGTRTGNLDPGVLLYLMREKKMTADDLERLLYHKSGLLGVSGISNDMRVLLESNEPAAKEAIDLFVFRIVKELGALAASIGGLDAVVFTAGIGERSSPIRRMVCERAAWMGIKLDEAANDANALRISTPDSPLSVWVVPTDEERMIALHTLEVLNGGA